jgi:hypothetical protein
VEAMTSNIKGSSMDIDKFKVEFRAVRRENDIRDQVFDGKLKDLDHKFKQTLGEADKFYMETFEEVKGVAEKVRKYCTDTVRGREKELNDAMHKLTTELRAFVDENVNDIVIERRQLVEKNEEQFKEIKLVCCKYFQKYDLQLEGMLDQSKEVMKKYQNWSKILIEPTSLNDARLYALETRVHTEEDVRVREFEYLRDVLRKLVYTFDENIAPNDNNLLNI